MLWPAFLSFVVLLLVFDLGVLHRRAEAATLRSAARWSIAWIALGVSFAGPVYLLYEHSWLGADVARVMSGEDAAWAYLTAYLLEKSLSVDNLFVIAIVFDAFQVPRAYRHRILFWGIFGAVVLRGIMIGSGLWALSRFDWLFPIFGAYLAWTGFKLFKAGDEDLHPESGRVVTWLKKRLPLVEGDHGPRFFVRTAAGYRLTTLALVLMAVEWTDVVFALDSVPAVLGVTSEPFLAFSSNVFAILGLRALFFVLEALLDRFNRLKYALAVILIFIGAKMLLHGMVHIPNYVSLGVVLGLLTIGMLMSGRGAAAPDQDEKSAD